MKLCFILFLLKFNFNTSNHSALGRSYSCPHFVDANLRETVTSDHGHAARSLCSLQPLLIVGEVGVPSGSWQLHDKHRSPRLWGPIAQVPVPAHSWVRGFG